ncbi:MAG: amidase domain-containing protein, partial [Elusimicrobiota bacterium]
MKAIYRKYFLLFCSIGFQLFLSADLFSYDRIKAVNYADTWAYGRNPVYHDYSEEGGDCTNFVSQCLIDGGLRFTNQGYMGIGNTIIRVAEMPSALQNYHGATISVNTIPSNFKVGDVISLGDDEDPYIHTVIVVEAGSTLDTIKVNAHTNDRSHEPLSSYAAVYSIVRYIQIPDSPIAKHVEIQQNYQIKYHGYHNYDTNQLVVHISEVVGVGEIKLKVVFDTPMKTNSNQVSFSKLPYVAKYFQPDGGTNGWTTTFYSNDTWCGKYTIPQNQGSDYDGNNY